MDGDTSSLYYTARGLMQLQSLYGTIPQIKGKGPHALAVKNLLTLMRREMGAKAPRTGQAPSFTSDGHGGSVSPPSAGDASQPP